MRKLKSILLVDDSKATNDLNKYHIGSMNLTEKIHVCLNGREALDYLTEADELPELIIMDIKMPVMGGFEFLEAYEEAFPAGISGVVIVMVSSSSSPEDLQRASESKMISGYYKKPLNKAILQEVMEKFFKDE
jgi:CheY-like chemotaxis protein